MRDRFGRSSIDLCGMMGVETEDIATRANVHLHFLHTSVAPSRSRSKSKSCSIRAADLIKFIADVVLRFITHLINFHSRLTQERR